MHKSKAALAHVVKVPKITREKKQAGTLPKKNRTRWLEKRKRAKTTGKINYG
jgi:hypothetical protein